MAEPLVNQYGEQIPRQIAAQISSVAANFNTEQFVADALKGYHSLDLMARGQHIAEALYRHLPADYEEAIDLLLASMGPRLERDQGNSMAPFLYLPHSFYIARYGLNHFEASMQAQYELTQRFTAEFCIRPYLQQHTEATLQRLHIWAEDSNHHVRRLVSEGTRPRLPWASRLKEFQQDPSPVLALLEKLKDDPELYVRRSVANNLNDIGKDHPELLTGTTRRWLDQAPPERLWLIRHALRSMIKQGQPEALNQLGYGKAPEVQILQASMTPAQVCMGDKVQLSFELVNLSSETQDLLIDFCVHYVKGNGSSSPKVFKLKTLQLAGHSSEKLSKNLSLANMSTRRHYPGTHQVDLLINGCRYPLGHFELSIAAE